MQLGIFGRHDAGGLAALADGAAALGWEPTWQRPSVFDSASTPECDVVVVHSAKGGAGAAAAHYRERGAVVLIYDLPPIRTGEHWALWPGELARLPAGDRPADRWDKLGIALRPRVRCGSAIILAGQSDGDAAHGMDLSALLNWARTTAKLLRAQQPYPIVWRPHPQRALALDGLETQSPYVRSLREELATGRYAGLVTYNSGAGLEALIEGVPAWASESAYYSELTASDSNFGRGYWPSDTERLAFFSRLSYIQWTAEEMASGEALAVSLDSWHAMREAA